MDLNIEHYPASRFSFPYLLPNIYVDINQAVRDKLKPGEQLTNRTALRILNQIQWKSTIAAIVTKPSFLIICSGVVMFSGFLIPATSTALLAARVGLAALGGYGFGFVYDNTQNNFLPRLSLAFELQNERAKNYIFRINLAQEELNFRLD